MAGEWEVVKEEPVGEWDVVSRIPIEMPDMSVAGQGQIREQSFLEQVKQKIGEQRGLGANIGGATGGALGVPLAVATKNPGAIPGAAVIGGAGGEAIEQLLFRAFNIPTAEGLAKTPTEAMQRINQAGANEGGAELIGGGIPGAASAVTRPFRKNITPGMKQALDFSKEQDIPLTAPTTTARALQATTEAVPTGYLASAYQRSKQLKKVQAYIDKTAPGLNLSGEKLSKALRAHVPQIISDGFEKSKAQYAKFVDRLDPSVNVAVPKVGDKIKELLIFEKKIVEDLQDKNLVSVLNQFLKKIEDGKGVMSPDLLFENQKRLSKLWGKVDDWKKVIEVREAIDEAWDVYAKSTKSPGLKADLDAARLGWQELKTTLDDNQLFQDIKKKAFWTKRPDIINQFTAAGNEAEVATYLGGISKQEVTQFRERYLANLFDPFKSPGRYIMKDVPNTPGKSYVDGNRMINYMKSNEDMIRLVNGDETYKNLLKFAHFQKEAMSDVAAGTSNIRGIGSLTGLTGSGALLASGHPVLFALSNASAPAVARSIMAPKGLLKKLFTEAPKFGPYSRTAMKVGGRPVMDMFTSREGEQQKPRLGLTQ